MRKETTLARERRWKVPRYTRNRCAFLATGKRDLGREKSGAGSKGEREGRSMISAEDIPFVLRDGEEGGCCWMIANECLNGKNLLIMERDIVLPLRLAPTSNFCSHPPFLLARSTSRHNIPRLLFASVRERTTLPRWRITPIYDEKRLKERKNQVFEIREFFD